MQELTTRLRMFFSLSLLTIILFGCVQTDVPDESVPKVQTNNTPTKVALLIPLTSEDPGIDQLAMNLEKSAQLALTKVESSSLELTTYDTQGTPEGAFQAASRAIGDGNSVILGPLFSDSTRAIAPLVNIRGVPVLSFSNDAMVAGGNIFILGQSFEDSANRMVQYVSSQGKVNGIIVSSDSRSDSRGMDALMEATTNAGFEIIQRISYELSQPGSLNAVEEIVLAVETFEPEVIFLTGNTAGAVTLIAELLNERDIPEDIILVGIERWDIPEVALSVKGLQGSIFPIPDPNQSIIFSNNYQYVYEEIPHPLAGLTYDGIIALDELMTENGTGVISRNSILNSGEFFGSTGPFKFNRSGITERSLAIAKIENQRTTIVDKAPRSLSNPPLDLPEN
ncbi:MAG: penicillin-binding protein activator [Rhodobacteraceae bacterium]|nr:penicillin-binding protein activator [Paracoccaceae bacterium]MYF46663.1 penicillin-binding protein activator [Paracoccaceae bacterium]MYI92647.1 penicillin-binding protein activator [Paracoccaceae bacterium]